MTRHQGGTPPGADQKPVNLALQGGGAHGAFAWGVLDKLLEDGRLTIDAMSATSAGAMNAVAATLDKACVFQTSTDRGQEVRSVAGRPGITA